jgi:HAMP domain-containing protein
MFEQFVHYVLGELHLIADAPLVFGAALLFLGAIIWAALRWRYSRMIERRNHIIALYKERLNGATPDQAKAKIDSLEGQVVSLKNREWPKLTPAAVTDFESVLASQGSHVVSVLPTDRDSVFFARDLVDAFKRIGWEAKREVSMNDVPDGLSVWPQDDVARAICNALMMATGAMVTVREDRHLRDQGTYVIGIGHKLD